MMKRTTATNFFALSLSVVLGACASGTASPPASPSPTARETQVPSFSPAASIGPTAEASTSPAAEGGQIVFSDQGGASSHTQVYIEHADGSDVRRLVTSDNDDAKPRLSPDGRNVAFTRYYPEVSNIVLVHVDGTGLRIIDKASCAKPCGGDEDVSWSPDGTQLAMTRGLFDAPSLAASTPGPYNVALWLIHADGSGAHQLTLKNLVCRNVCKGGAQDNRAAWSPDGTRLVFMRDSYTSPEQFGIFTIALNGSDLRRVTPVTMNVDDPAWSPEGDLIAFQSPQDPSDGVEQDIFTIHPDGSGLTKLTSGLGFGWSNGASWSPDGKQIVFSHFSPNRPSDLYVMNRDGSDLHLLAPTALIENSPNWGPAP